MKIKLENAVVYQGSNLDVLPTLPDNSVDSIVTDPPYELGFMGKSWDNSGIAYSVELWTECMRVLKPGGHLLAFGGSRTWHRLAVAIEDAGFEMRDSIAWLYGSGFPKSMDVAKAIQKASGVEPLDAIENKDGRFYGEGYNATPRQLIMPELEGEAKQWQGWGTALKPAFEPVVVARKPLEEKTVAANVLKYGTGGLNIDGSRIDYQGEKPSTWFQQEERKGQNIPFGSDQDTSQPSSLGRWPANIILDPYTAELLDEQSGISKDGTAVGRNRVGIMPNSIYGTYKSDTKDLGYQGAGGASRFFYVAKASKKDRNEGLDELPEIDSPKGNNEGRDMSKQTNHLGGMQSTKAANFHPTVKPTSLMEYLIKLVTPPNGTVLDPFTGSGSTGKAALLSGFKFIGIELTEEYLPIIEGRLKWASEQVSQEKDEVLF